MNSSGWCNTPAPLQLRVVNMPGDLLCPFPITDIKGMLRAQENYLRFRNGDCNCCKWPECSLYNELVLDPRAWDLNLPWTIEAVLFPAGNELAEMQARQWHRMMLHHFNLNASELPLMSMDDTTTQIEPFHLVN